MDYVKELKKADEEEFESYRKEAKEVIKILIKEKRLNKEALEFMMSLTSSEREDYIIMEIIATDMLPFMESEK
tara:strand:+ start:366 stop:584 length:219 start_codon:yes stop_codon:yes gene_type:complete